MLQRPDAFTLDPFAPLAQRQVCAGLGRYTRSSHYHDSGRLRNHGTVYSTDPATDWMFASELGRWGLYLDGEDDYVYIPDILVPAADPLTVSCWWYSPVWVDEWAAMLEAASGDGLYFFGGNGGTLYSARKTNENVVWQSIDKTGWHHYCFAHTGSTGTGTMYFDGAQVGQATNKQSSALTGIKLGKWSNAWTRGRCADFLLHNRLLAPYEIEQLADPSNVMLSGLLLPPRRVFWPVSSGGSTSATFNASALAVEAAVSGVPAEVSRTLNITG